MSCLLDTRIVFMVWFEHILCIHAVISVQQINVHVIWHAVWKMVNVMHLLLCCQSWQLIFFSTEILYFLNFEYLRSRTRTILLVRCSCKYPYVVTCSVQSSMSKLVPTMVFYVKKIHSLPHEIKRYRYSAVVSIFLKAILIYILIYIIIIII